MWFRRKTTKQLKPEGFGYSLGDPDDPDVLIYLHTSSKVGWLRMDYVFSLNRYPKKDTINVMVVDQRHHDVSDIEIVMSGDQMFVRLPDDDASQLDNITEYTLSFEGEDSEILEEINTVLEKLFEPSVKGTYRRTNNA